MLIWEELISLDGNLTIFIQKDWKNIKRTTIILVHEKVTWVGRHLSNIENHHKLVGYVLIGEAKSTMKNKEEINTFRTSTMACKRILGIGDIVEESSACTRIRL